MKSIVIAIFVVLIGNIARSEEFTLVVQTKTGQVNNAGTNEPVFFAIHYMDEKEVPNRNKNKPPRTVPDQKRIEVPLDNSGDDRKTGAVETYRVKIDCPIEKICGVEIGLKSGDDAWYLDGFRYTVETDKKISSTVTVPFSGWLSGAANDGGKKTPAKQFYFFKVAAPKLSDKPAPKR